MVVRTTSLRTAAGLAAFLVLAVAASINLRTNVDRLGLGLGLSFLNEPANVAVQAGVRALAPTDSAAFALAIGFANSLAVAIVAIVLAGALGFAGGLCQLLRGRALRAIVDAVLNLVRNTPLVVQLFLWYALALALPRPLQTLPGQLFYVTNRGIYLPLTDAVSALYLLAAGPSILVILLSRQPTALRLAMAACLVAAGLLIVGIDVPQKTGSQIVGGLRVRVEYSAMVAGLGVYFAAFVSDIVRFGLRSVPLGKGEGCAAIGLSRMQAIRLVVLPQALRSMTPPLAALCISIVKTSSLGVAIGYTELTSISGSIISQKGHAIEVIAVTMLVYLIFNATLGQVATVLTIHQRRAR